MVLIMLIAGFVSYQQAELSTIAEEQQKRAEENRSTAKYFMQEAIKHVNLGQPSVVKFSLQASKQFILRSGDDPNTIDQMLMNLKEWSDYTGRTLDDIHHPSFDKIVEVVTRSACDESIKQTPLYLLQESFFSISNGVFFGEPENLGGHIKSFEQLCAQQHYDPNDYQALVSLEVDIQGFEEPCWKLNSGLSDHRSRFIKCFGELLCSPKSFRSLTASAMRLAHEKRAHLRFSWTLSGIRASSFEEAQRDLNYFIESVNHLSGDSNSEEFFGKSPNEAFRDMYVNFPKNEIPSYFDDWEGEVTLPAVKEAIQDEIDALNDAIHYYSETSTHA